MSLRLNGSTSGYVEIDAPAVAGTTSITIPATSGEAIVKAANGSVDLGSVDIDSSGRLLVGTSTTRSNFFNGFSSWTPQHQIETAGSSSVGVRSVSFTYGRSNGDAPIFAFAKHRSDSIGGTTVVQSGDGAGAISFQASDGTDFVEAANISAVVDGTPGANDMPGRLVFSTTLDGASSPTARMIIANTGQVSISPNNTVGLRIDSNTSAETFIIAGNGSNLQVKHPAAGVELINTAGNAIRVVANTNGVSLAGGGTSWAAISDEHKKTDLVPIENGLSKVNTLRAVIGRYKTDEPEVRRSFLIAQDVQAVLPEAVDDSDPGELGLRYTEVIPLLVAALKESKERIETLEAEVAALKAQ